MNEFDLIDTYFKPLSTAKSNVLFGIGDDAACVRVPAQHDLLISTDTLVSGVHFLSHWDAYDIACKAVMVNVSDMAAMAAKPQWITLALTMPTCDELWLKRFSAGLRDSLNQYQLALIGGDTTKGPLSITITIHGVVPKGRAIKRSGAKPNDAIYVSGALGAASLAVAFLKRDDIDKKDYALLMNALLHPIPRVDLAPLLQTYASAAIDISDGLLADLHHICAASGVGARLLWDSIPVNPLVSKYEKSNAIDFALRGGDDYELCFTIDAQREAKFLASLKEQGISCCRIGEIEANKGIRAVCADGKTLSLTISGYRHF